MYEYFPFGGLQRDCLKSAQVCAGRGHDVTILTRTWRGERPTGAVGVQCFGRHGWNNYRRNLHWLVQLRKSLPGLAFDAVIGFDKLPDLDVYFGADPCFLAKVERLKPFWYRWLRRYRQLASLERHVFEQGRATQILQLTPWEIPIYQKYYGTEEQRFHLLPANATRRTFEESARLRMRQLKREEQGWDPEDLLLILVGSDFRRKGLDRILRGMASLPPAWRLRCRLAILGECAPGRFRSLARGLGLGERVHFLGGRMDAPDWMLAADLMVHPAYVETAGAVLVEALTAGLPVLTTAVCGYAFHIETARAGHVLPDPFQQADFNRALGEMVRSPEDRARWRAQALDYASRENIYDCHEQVANIIEETTRRKLARSARVG